MGWRAERHAGRSLRIVFHLRGHGSVGPCDRPWSATSRNLESLAADLSPRGVAFLYLSTRHGKNQVVTRWLGNRFGGMLWEIRLDATTMRQNLAPESHHSHINAR